MEIIQLPGYTQQEKIEIGKRFPSRSRWRTTG
jgi:ATP-dependent Lon protease